MRWELKWREPTVIHHQISDQLLPVLAGGCWWPHVCGCITISPIIQAVISTQLPLTASSSTPHPHNLQHHCSGHTHTQHLISCNSVFMMKMLLCSLTIDTACLASCPQIKEAKRLSGSGYEPDHHWSIARSGEERLRPPTPCPKLFATWNEREYSNTLPLCSLQWQETVFCFLDILFISCKIFHYWAGVRWHLGTGDMIHNNITAASFIVKFNYVAESVLFDFYLNIKYTVTDFFLIANSQFEKCFSPGWLVPHCKWGTSGVGVETPCLGVMESFDWKVFQDLLLWDSVPRHFVLSVQGQGTSFYILLHWISAGIFVIR